ncbi:PilZ domain-containing protein [Pseudoalteromonas mariniglutinosa]|uniref:PilZ domain-containing protein n=1 Tax=Pseudoalteromonas mariniglutinosa TaxID=206042 RepID=UPI00384F6D02
MKNRRQFSRVLFSTSARLDFAHHQYACQILDVSLRGVLITKNETFSIPKDSKAILTFKLPDSDIQIQMMVSVCHIEQQHIGLQCDYIDIDSITHLKRLIELNLADDTLLHRELVNLISEAE